MSKSSNGRLVPRVYSYIRFSTPEQAMGDSERRQLDLAKAFAASPKIGMPLDTTLRLTDRGVSGFRGTHRKQGKLGQFLKEVDDGNIAPGSILVVENVDRLSREPFLTAFSVISQIIEAGITIQTLTPDATYDRKAVEGLLIYQLVGQMQMAHEESKKKSKRVGEARDSARKAARESGKILTKNVPAWIDVTADGKLVPNRDAAKAIKLVFKLRIDGLSAQAIVKRLNQPGNWSPPPVTKKSEKQRGGNGWRQSYVKKILANRAVIGEYQPYKNDDGSGRRGPVGEPIADFFPIAVKPDVFHAVQKLLAANKGKGGRNGKVRNVLRHLAKCAYCGGPMAFEDKGEPPKGGRYFYCDWGRRESRNDKGELLCSRHSIRYDEVQKLILDNCPKLRPEQVLPNPGDSIKRGKAIRAKISGIDGEQADIEKRLTNLVDAIAEAPTKSLRERLYQSEAKHQARHKELIATRKQLEQELTTLESGEVSFANWQRNLTTLRSEIDKEENADLRMILNAHLREFIERIEIFADGHRRRYDPELVEAARQQARKLIDASPRKPKDRYDVEWVMLHPLVMAADRDGDRFEDRMHSAFDAPISKSFAAFVEDVATRRMTKEGRFVRVYFTTGQVIDLVPPGSLADGYELKKNREDFAFVSPVLEKLWQTYKTTHLPKKKPKATISRKRGTAASF